MDMVLKRANLELLEIGQEQKLKMLIYFVDMVENINRRIIAFAKKPPHILTALSKSTLSMIIAENEL
jgi:hypothetical protein